MLQLATIFTEPILPQAVAKLPWGHIRELLPLSNTPEVQIFYIERCAQEGWSRAVLLNQMRSQLHLRVGAAPTNFALVEPPESSELISQLVKDPYNFEFLTLASDAAERDVESGLVANLAKTLQELGVGFFYVGRQYRLTLTGDDGHDDEFFLDLLFYHYLLRRFVVFELKVDKFRPEYAGKLNFYCNVVDDQVRHYDSHDGPTIGILLCASKSNTVVDYALRGIGSPMAVAEYSFSQLPPELQEALPSPADLQSIADEALDEAAAADELAVSEAAPESAL